MLKLVLIGICFLLISFISINEAYHFPKPLYFPAMPVNEANPVSKKGVELGRYLFYDPILSLDSTVSCATCHQQRFAFSDSPNAMSHGVHQSRGIRNTPALFNLAWYESLFWDGRASNIEDQALQPIRGISEMAFNWREVSDRIRSSTFYQPLFRQVFGDSTSIDSTTISFAIAQFERTLISHNSKMDQAARGELFLNEQELRGYELINNQIKGNCLHCHNIDDQLLGTSGKFENNGLDSALKAKDFTDPGLGGFSGKEQDYGKFKVPSLRNLAFTAPYMHDGRFKNLEEVLNFYNEEVTYSYTIAPQMEQVHETKKRLTQTEIEDIIAYLQTLNDSSFITNPEFSNPFEQ